MNDGERTFVSFSFVFLCSYSLAFIRLFSMTIIAQKYLDNKEPGIQYVRDATDLRGIPDSKYDFVLASHALEHIANPLKAMSEWTRVS